MLISFGWTAQALISGEKTTTLRQWNPRYAARFHQGQLVDAWNRGPRQHGYKIATIRLTEGLRYRWLGELYDDAEAYWRSEGFAFYHAHPETMPRTIFGRSTKGIDFSLDWFRQLLEEKADERYYVLRFEMVEVCA